MLSRAGVTSGTGCLEAVALQSKPAGFDLRLGPCGVCHAGGRSACWATRWGMLALPSVLDTPMVSVFGCWGPIDMHTGHMDPNFRINLGLLSAVRCPHFGGVWKLRSSVLLRAGRPQEQSLEAVTLLNLCLIRSSCGSVTTY